ncbi:hypothetical protein WSM22_36110 [Cytophagales bacterium WSM2-2]|nr:hypothetical protein WSM22_36110 [Cytophagales bacterium WSM2-2]
MKTFYPSTRNGFLFVFLVLIVMSCSGNLTSQSGKKGWTEESIKKYLDDNAGKLDPVEGIYSISSEKTDKVLSKFIPATRKSNDYARVAILRNTEGFTPEFVELILEGLNMPKYTKTAEFTRIQKSFTYLSKQLDNGVGTSYSFALDEATGSMDGYKKSDTTSKLLYLKLYPVK